MKRGTKKPMTVPIRTITNCLKALDGATKTIKRNLPKLYVCAYHRNEDLFALGKKILSFDKRYKLYFRHSLYIPAWESNFYAIID